jgi:transcriptional regulator with XRE-family HTH domain
MRSSLRRKFGANMREIRRDRGLTQEALAERCDLSIDAIRRVEWGTISPSLDTLWKLSDGLDITLATLFETFENERRDAVAELCDLVAKCDEKEIQLMREILRVLHTQKAKP